ncbi:MAG: hypothetical protein AAF797_15275 [Planctomycetota bacterium]
MSSGPDYQVEISGIQGHSGALGGGAAKAAGVTGGAGRPWIAVTYECCSVYSRVYRNRDGTAYEGKCPKCGKTVKAAIGPGGTATRFFRAE